MIFIATGRTLEEVRDVLPAGMEADGMVTANGMSVLIGKEKIVEHALSTELVEELVAKAGAEEVFTKFIRTKEHGWHCLKIKTIWLNKV
ncbi:HAD hydrolase family protein [[Brevibacterium] frigoritolerans]|uniref:HAD hydrolase family protein n=1 Tax=Peribacillus frigoritolerans TaxID=450367 RepID=A0A941J4B8_9BACI|nr:HAD hydrolase family protein [Peribacillus frigoritolerans]